MNNHRHLLSAGIAVFAIAVCGAACLALTVEVELTLAYVREHPKEFTVDVTQGKTGLIDFKIVHNVATPMYHVAHFALYRDGKPIAESHTPSFGKKQDNTFYLSVAPENLADASFDLSDSALGGAGENAVPLPGTMIIAFV